MAEDDLRDYGWHGGICRFRHLTLTQPTPGTFTWTTPTGRTYTTHPDSMPPSDQQMSQMRSPHRGTRS